MGRTTTIRATVGQNLRHARRRLDLTAAQLARITSAMRAASPKLYAALTADQIGALEKACDPRLHDRQMRTLAAALGVPLGLLFLAPPSFVASIRDLDRTRLFQVERARGKYKLGGLAERLWKLAIAELIESCDGQTVAAILAGLMRRVREVHASCTPTPRTRDEMHRVAVKLVRQALDFGRK